ncbi:protein NRT1/ PTR FAMILY 5.5-like [Rosa rugosa]|uniref:protein NRT1/ PTR FAMILY 5.5-like n=1 Tax=Rosa rugosa TaxID=74645 RepID=UPI002B4182C8|nr:protein NRT1/ PTR FAMILY 5.5-like [Rosa rugosa]
MQGLGLLTVSSPPVLSGATDSCSASQTQCLSQVQKILFYVSLPLIALGMAGQITSVEAFADQNSKPSWKMMGINGLVISFIVSALTSVCVVLALGHIKPWWILFGIAAICTLGATLTFLSGSASYKYPKSQESAITTLLRVFVASFSKLSKTHPGCDSLYISHSFYQIPYTNRLRCLDKAAIILPASPSIEQQQKRRWRLCTVTEVEETKKIWMNFILIGVVSSIGNTYFVEQANNLNKRYGLKIEGHSRGPFPLLVLLVLQEYARALLSHLPWEEPCRLSRPFKHKEVRSPTCTVDDNGKFMLHCSCIGGAS